MMFYKFDNISRKELFGKSGVYRITNEVNGKIYIGSTVNLYKRLSDHKEDLFHNRNTVHLQRSVNKYGIENFSLDILTICEKEHVLFYEQKYIDITQCFLPKYGYNILDKAESTTGYKHTEEAIEKMKNIPRKPNKTSFKTGQKRTKESLEKAKATWKNNYNNPERIQARINRGKNVSERQKGKPLPKNALIKAYEKTSKKVIRISDNFIYKSIAEAARENKIGETTVKRRIVKGIDFKFY